MLEKVVEVLSKIFSKEFTQSLSAFIFQLSREDITGEEKKEKAVDFGVALLDSLKGSLVARLPGGFVQWIAGQVLSWLDDAEREWVGAQVEVIWRAMKMQTALLKANPEHAAELLGGTVSVEGQIVLPVQEPDRDLEPSEPPPPPATEEEIDSVVREPLDT